MLHYIFNYIHKIEFSFTYIHFCVVQRSVFIGQTFSIAPLTDKPRSRSLNICPLHGHNIACINEVLCRNVKNLTLLCCAKMIGLETMRSCETGENAKLGVSFYLYRSTANYRQSSVLLFIFYHSSSFSLVHLYSLL